MNFNDHFFGFEKVSNKLHRTFKITTSYYQTLCKVIVNQITNHGFQIMQTETFVRLTQTQKDHLLNQSELPEEQKQVYVPIPKITAKFP